MKIIGRRRRQRWSIEDVRSGLGVVQVADLLFEVVTQRYTERSIVLTTNKPFSEWNDVFPNASCVVTLVDRLVHKSEIVVIRAESYRLKEAKEHAAEKAKKRREQQPKEKRSGKNVTE